jgi:uncharacterized protein (DUF2062 family)
MPKRLIKRITANREAVRNHKHLKVFGSLLHDPNLWHINRRSSAGAFAIGLFMAFVPLPFQMVWAAGAAILFRVNLTISVALVWVTNPITIPPIFFFAYLIGTWILGESAAVNSLEFTFEWLKGGGLKDVWKPLVVGSLICGAFASLTGYFLIRGLWRLNAVRQWEKRRQERQAKKQEVASSH